MDATQIAILFGAALLISLPLVRSYGRNVQMREIEGKLPPAGFSMTQGIIGVDRKSGLSFDEAGGKVCLVVRTDAGTRQKVVDIKDILSSEIFENGASVTRTVRSSQIAGTIVGGLAWGGVGAIIGGLSGKTETRSKPERVELRLIVNDTTNPVHDVVFMTNSSGDSANKYELALRAARRWHGIAAVLIQRADEMNKEKRSSSAAVTPPQAFVADELEKLVELRDSGALSDEEFQEQKRRLLSATRS